MALGQRFKVLILFPVILFTVSLASGAAIERADAAWSIGKTAAVVIVGLQIGYLLGMGFRHLIVLARSNRPRTASLASSLPPQRSAH